MNKKYKFTGETREIVGVTVHRIRALVDFSIVKAGDLGGWIESEANLSQEGDAWVFDNATVFGNAFVSGDALVFGNALVYGGAMVYGDARVSGDARVCGDAMVCGHARVFGDALVSGKARVYGDAKISKTDHYMTAFPMGSRNDTTTFFRCADKSIKVRCGCFYGTIDEFVAKVKETHGDNKYAKTYLLLAELAKAQIELDEENGTT